MPRNKAKTYARLMVDALDGLSEKEAKQKIHIIKQLLHKRGDFKQVSRILQEFTRAWKERKGKVATVLSAEPLVDKMRKQFQEALSKKRYIMEERIDPSAIGGVALSLGNEFLIDGTIRGKLKRISKLLTISNE